MSHYKPYPAYKDSGVEWIGEVPEHWDVKRLGSFFIERREKVSDKEFQPLSVTMLGVVPQIEGVAKTEDNDNRKKVCAGDFVINSRSDRKGSSGLSTLDGSVSLINIVLRPNDDVVGRFVHHLLRSNAFQEEYYRYGNGIVADLWTTHYSEMRNIYLAIAPERDQQVIASALDRETTRIDALIAKKTRFIELLKEKRQALITHAVTKGLDPKVKMKDSEVEWIGEVPEYWSICKLSYRYSVELGKMLDEKKITGNHPVAYLRNKDVQWERINITDLPLMDISPAEVERYTIKDGDLLVCEGGDIGRAAIWRGANNIIGYQKALHRLRAISAKKDLVEFYFYALYSAKNNGVFEEDDTKSTISHLPAEKFREYKFAFPPIGEQQAVVEFLTKKVGRINLLTEKTQHSIDLLKERRSALITAAVTGKIDLRESP